MHALQPDASYQKPPAAAAGLPRTRPSDYATWTRRWLLGVCLSGLAVVSCNVLLDPYQVFNVLALRDSYTPNEIYNKLQHLLAHPQRHDAFFVGSSRMGMFEPQAAEAIHPQRSYYNLSVLGVEPREQLAMLKALRAGGVTIREVVIGIDLYPFLTRRTPGDPAHRPHPAMSEQSRLEFLSSYLFLASYGSALRRLVHTLKPEPTMAFDFQGSGRYHLLDYDAQRAVDPSAYLAKHLPPITDRTPPAGPPRWVESAFDDLDALRRWCLDNDVQAYWFVHPLHPSVLINVPDGALEVFRERIAALMGPLPDFSQDSRFLASRDYYDAKHYVPALAQQLLVEIMGAPATPPTSGAAAMPIPHTTGDPL
jgi:hypothetical protein